MDSMVYKKCANCKQEKLLEHFYTNIRTVDGFMYKCKQCLTSYTKLWRKLNPDKTKKQRLRWRMKHPEKFAESGRRARRIRRMKQAGAISTLIPEQWEMRLQEFNFHCAYCLQPFNNLAQEHMQPISRNGLHTIDNIIPSCKSCNSSKCDKTILEYFQYTTSPR